MPKRKALPLGIWRSNLEDFTKLAQSRKVFHLEVDKIVIVKLKRNMLMAKVCVLDRVYFLPISWCYLRRPVYRIGNHTIKDSQVSNLIVSLDESSNLCILGIIFLGSYP
jgi:hypothetical protein